MIAVLLVAIARPDVDLVIPGAREGAPPVSPWLAAGAALLLIGLAGLVWLVTTGDDPTERAFVRLAGELALSRRHRRLLRDLAAALGLPGPMPVLLSASARARAAETLGIPRGHLADLERRIPPL
jgi:hypothetical protein